MAGKNFSLFRRGKRNEEDGVNVDVNTFKVPLILAACKNENVTILRCEKLFSNIFSVHPFLSLKCQRHLFHFSISISYQRNIMKMAKWRKKVTIAKSLCVRERQTFPVARDKKEWASRRGAEWKITCCASCYFASQKMLHSRNVCRGMKCLFNFLECELS